MFVNAAKTRGNIGPEPKPELPHESVLTCLSNQEANAIVCGFGGLLGSGPCEEVGLCAHVCVCLLCQRVSDLTTLVIPGIPSCVHLTVRAHTHTRNSLTAL